MICDQKAVLQLRTKKHPVINGQQWPAQRCRVSVDPGNLGLLRVALVAGLPPHAARIDEVLIPLASAGEGRHVRQHQNTPAQTGQRARIFMQ